MSARTLPTTSPGPCRCCGQRSYRADDLSPVHECCLAWQRVISFGYPCPACQIAHYVARTGRLPDEPPRLSRTLPDGTPYAPD